MYWRRVALNPTITLRNVLRLGSQRADPRADGGNAMAWTTTKLGALPPSVLAALQLVNPAASYAGGAGTCSGGSVAPGSYSSLTISCFCTVDAGTVNVATNLTVAPGGELVAVFGGSDVHVGGNLTVQSSGVLILG